MPVILRSCVCDCYGVAETTDVPILRQHMTMLRPETDGKKFWQEHRAYVSCFVVTSSGVFEGVWNKVILWTLVYIQLIEFHVHNDNSPETKQKESQTSNIEYRKCTNNRYLTLTNTVNTSLYSQLKYSVSNKNHEKIDISNKTLFKVFTQLLYFATCKV